MTADVQKHSWQANKDVVPKVSMACSGIVDLVGKSKVSELQVSSNAGLHGATRPRRATRQRRLRGYVATQGYTAAHGCMCTGYSQQLPFHLFIITGEGGIWP